MDQNKPEKLHADRASGQAQELLEELEDVRRKYGLAGALLPRQTVPGEAAHARHNEAAVSKEEGVIMTDQEKQKDRDPREANPPAADQPVYYDANGNPVTPVVYYDAQGRPVVPVFAAQPVQAQPEERYETLPDGSRVRVVYQEPESKRAAAPGTPPAPQAAPAKGDKPAPNPEHHASMRVVYESPEAHMGGKKTGQAPARPAETQQGSAPQAAGPEESVSPGSSGGLADLFADVGQEEPPKKKKKKKGKQGSFGDRWFPWRGDTVGEKIRRVIFPIALLTLLVSLPMLGVRLYDGWYNQYFIKSLEGQVQPGLDDSAWDAIRAKHPGVSFPEGMNPAYADLYAANQDMVGWLKIENTKYINFPIVQTKDNDVYLKRDFYGRKTDYGNPFLDFRNNAKELDRNTIVFGHHMRSGDQEFSALTDYLTIEGFKRNPVIDFNTLYANYQWKVYAVFLTNSEARHDNGYIFNYIFTNLASDEKFMEYVGEIDQRKLYSTGVDIQPTDKILTLSTCNYDWDEQRLVVVARMVREGESASVDTSLAKKNENPRYPQVYYDLKGIENPYRDAEKWKA